MTRLAVALLAGLIVFALLTYSGGCNDSDPPECFGAFGWYRVPTDGWVAPLAGLAAGVIVYVALWWLHRRRQAAAA